MSHTIRNTEAELMDFLSESIRQRLSASSPGSLGDGKWFRKLTEDTYIGGDSYSVYSVRTYNETTNVVKKLEL